ncbi:DUF3085 domain-containing protein [Acetobacter okinawensis]|uniref:DUF3085 domain-containing protein n=2 Tax=Acetobacter TaxID=434 RepID=UPI00046FA704|nr:DUF3085 domain-containing protein [Acetobacter okinawensis]
MKLHFDRALVERLLAHAEAAQTHSPTLDQLFSPAYQKERVIGRMPTADDIDDTRIPAGLMLVGDQGVYLMSNGKPCLPDPAGSPNLVVYAQEADPRGPSDDWYDVKLASFGGDDGAEFLSADTIRQALKATGDGPVWIDVSPTDIRAPCLSVTK